MPLWTRHYDRQRYAPICADDLPSLRIAKAADRDFLLALFCTTHRALYEALSHLPIAAGEALLEMQLQAQYDSYRQRFPGTVFKIICDAEGRSAGRLTVARTATDFHLLDIALLPAYRDRGWGSRLIASLQSEAAAANMPLQLTVAHSNRAKYLYWRMGFMITAKVDLDIRMIWLPLASSK